MRTQMWSEVSESLRLGLVAFVLMSVVVLLVLRLTRRNQMLRQRLRFPLVVIFLLLTFYDIFYSLGRSIPRAIELYYFAALYLVIAILAIRIIILLLFSFLTRNRNYRVPKLLEEISKVVLYTLATIAILQYTLNIQVATVLATSAIITVVLGLALQETLGNLFAGLALHLDPAYQVGDWIKAGENTGRVEEITWRATKLRTTNNDFIIIPNGSIAKEKLWNFSFPRTPHATNIFVGVSYGVPPNKVDRVVNQALAEIDNVTLDPPPDVRVQAFQDFAVNYQIKFYIKDYGLVEPTMAKVKRSLWYHFRRNGIEIPFPIRNVHLHDQDERRASDQRETRRQAESLRNVYLFAPLDEDERMLIADSLEEAYYAPNETVIREGDAGDSFFIIEEGEVEVYLTSLSGHRKVLTRLGPGDFFGEIALLSGSKRTASVQAMSDLKVHVLRKDSFREVLERKPDILDEIGSVLSRRKDQLVDLMAEVTADGSGDMGMTSEQAKSRILNRIRNYFGL